MVNIIEQGLKRPQIRSKRGKETEKRKKYDTRREIGSKRGKETEKRKIYDTQRERQRKEKNIIN